MNIFGIGPLELLVVLAVALIFLGPEKLPEMARALGKALHQFQNIIEPYREEVSRAMAPVDEVQRDVQQTLRGVPSRAAGAAPSESAASASPLTPAKHATPDEIAPAALETTPPAVMPSSSPHDVSAEDETDLVHNTIAPPRPVPDEGESQ